MYCEMNDNFLLLFLMSFLLYFSVLSGASLNQKMLLYRRQLNVARESLYVSETHHETMLS